MALANALVPVYSTEKEFEVTTQVPVPDVFKVPIRADVINFAHARMRLNSRQAYAVAPFAGEQTSAESWGTGRAVARIPRVGGGGTHRSGQGAFGNMCRGGRMFGATKVWRRWHRKVNKSLRRYAVASALAASAVTALVMARGHRISRVADIPLVVDSGVESYTKTKEVVALLKKIRAFDDLIRVRNGKHLREGKGKRRVSKYKNKKGPLFVYNKDNGIVKAARAIHGLELVQVDNLSVLHAAPGGHVGRFIIWTADAFGRLNELFGTYAAPSTKKTGFTLPRPIMTNPDIYNLMKSDEIKSVIPAKPFTQKQRRSVKKNPLRNAAAMAKLNPYAFSLKLSEKRRAAKKEVTLKARRAGNEKFEARMAAQKAALKAQMNVK